MEFEAAAFILDSLPVRQHNQWLELLAPNKSEAYK
jgi:hypothetical protein